MSHRTSEKSPIDIGIQASSITHQHLLASVATEMRGRSTFKVVDVGCGGGALINYLRVGLPAILPGVGIDVDGFDVSDFVPDWYTKLTSATKAVRSGDPWPYADHSVMSLFPIRFWSIFSTLHFFSGKLHVVSS